MGNPKGYKAPKGERGVWLPVDPGVRLRTKFEEGPADECWPWLGHVSKRGYGIFWFGGRRGHAHRAAYELLVGPVPEGFHVDHTCHNDSGCEGGDDCLHRRCVNPRHLEAVPPAINKSRGESLPAANARKTHCPKGHPYAGDNLMLRKNGDRRCRTCVYEQNRQYDARRRTSAKG